MKITKGKYYLEKLKALHPEEDKRVLSEIISFGCHAIVENLKENKEIKIKSYTKGRNLDFLIYKKRGYKNAKGDKK